MKLSKKDAKLFLEIFKFYPFVKIAATVDIPSEISELLNSELQRCEGELDIFENDNFRPKRGVYDYVVICDTLDENILQTAKNSLKAVAELVVLLDKNRFGLYEAVDKISEADFAAANDIDLFDEYHLITAKRLLMYGV
ncbi:hypothetical protein [Nitrosophilus alvini]|uniref:hypothetical protein n=1 Tax=Nitrosophilus alvini TaxID=2714855 RepID=UPI0019094C49|nr:hypothetical protein [Nitrosophilus alvini]